MKEELTKLIEDLRTDIKGNKREIEREDDPIEKACLRSINRCLVSVIIRMKDIK